MVIVIEQFLGKYLWWFWLGLHISQENQPRRNVMRMSFCYLLISLHLLGTDHRRHHWFALACHHIMNWWYSEKEVCTGNGRNWRISWHFLHAIPWYFPSLLLTSRENQLLWRNSPSPLSSPNICEKKTLLTSDEKLFKRLQKSPSRFLGEALQTSVE